MKFSTRTFARPLVPGLVFLTLALGGCVAPESSGVVSDMAEEEPAQLNEEPQDATQIITEEPVAGVDLPDGAVIRFYAHRDGSVSVEEEGDAYHAAVSSRPEFAEATAFDLYHAVAGPDAEVPEALLSYHEAMLADATVEPTIDSSSLPQGWLRAQLESLPPAIAADPCPGLIQNFVCNGAGSAYPGGPGCFGAWTGSFTWNHGSNAKRRYRTGFCTTGTANAVITGSYAGPGNCIVFRPLFIYRNGNYTNHNYNYWWSGPSGATPRSYSNHVQHISGTGVSWGVRDKAHTSSSCTI